MTSHGEGTRAEVRLEPAGVLRYRARVSHLDRKLPRRWIAKAAWGGLQDSVPRAGITSLHARVDGAGPNSWEDPSLVQIWFRGGTDYIVPREDVGIFTLGCLPRDPERVAALERLADDIHHASSGQITPVGEVATAIGHRLASDPLHPRASSTTGRVHIRWDASRIWLIPVERPSIDPEEARRALARRFLHWYGPRTVQDLARWTGVGPAEARATWQAIEDELAPVEIEGEVGENPRFVLASDVEAFLAAEPIDGVRLLPMDDPFTRFDHEWLVADAAHRERSLPRWGQSPGYLPGTVLVDGEVVGGWQRQGRKVTIHPFRSLSARVHAQVEAEARTLPIAGAGNPSVTWA